MDWTLVNISLLVGIILGVLSIAVLLYKGISYLFSKDIISEEELREKKEEKWIKKLKEKGLYKEKRSFGFWR